MKVSIKGLVFVGFAAAILSANAMAADNTVTSKSYVDNKFQVKSTEASIGGENGNWTPLDTVVNDTTAAAGGAPTTGAVKTYVDNKATSLASEILTDTLDPEDSTHALTNAATTTALGEKQNKDTSGHYVVGQNGNWAAVNSAVADSGTHITTTNETNGSVTINVSDITSVGTGITASSTSLTEGKAVYEYVQAVASTIDGDMDSYQLLSEKTDSIAANATSTTAYPSAKGVADYVSSQLADTSIVGRGDFTVSINGASQTFNANQATNTSLTVEGLEVTSNKANTISATNSDNTDAYPSTKAVYDYVQGLPSSSLPGVDTSICDSTHPCALVTDTSTGAAKWVRIVQQGE